MGVVWRGGAQRRGEEGGEREGWGEVKGMEG